MENPADWNWVAIGTLTLAVVTATQAWLTRRLVEGTQKMAGSADREADATLDSVRLSQAALEAQSRPLLVNLPTDSWTPRSEIRMQRDLSVPAVYPVETDSDALHVVCSLYLRNAGTGLAVIKSHALGHPAAGAEGYPTGTWQLGQIKNVFIEPGEMVGLEYRVPNDEEGFGLNRLRSDVPPAFEALFDIDATSALRG